MSSKKTVVVGASNDRSRYSYQAVLRLMKYGHEVIPVSNKKGEVNGLTIHNDFPKIEDVDTVTLYVGPKNQEFYMDYILSLKPKRIIFNPGTANPLFEEKAKKAGIEVVPACTLVMLSIGNY